MQAIIEKMLLDGYNLNIWTPDREQGFYYALFHKADLLPQSIDLDEVCSQDIGSDFTLESAIESAYRFAKDNEDSLERDGVEATPTGWPHYQIEIQV